MGTTFQLADCVEADRGLLQHACPLCGARSEPYREPDDPAANRDCENCLGYGGDREAENRYWEQRQVLTGALDLGLATGWAALAWLDREGLPSGEIDSAEALSALLRVADPADWAREPDDATGPHSASEAARFIDCGRPAERLVRAHADLVALARRAVRQGSWLSWS